VTEAITVGVLLADLVCVTSGVPNSLCVAVTAALLVVVEEAV